MQARREDNDLIARFTALRDAALREEIILRYVPLVHFVLGRLGLSQAMGADYEDAASQGLLGLIEAVDRFDPAYGAQFSTYATLRIRGKVLDHLRSLDWLSRGARQRAKSVQHAVSALWETLQRPPSEDELAAHLGMGLQQLQQALVDSSHVIVSLDTLTTGEGDEETALHEILPDTSQTEVSAAFEEDELKASLGDALRSLPEREQQVLSLYYYEELTLKEIGAVLSISESRVCQLHSRAVLSLRASMSSARDALVDTASRG